MPAYFKKIVPAYFSPDYYTAPGLSLELPDYHRLLQNDTFRQEYAEHVDEVFKLGLLIKFSNYDEMLIET